MAQEPAGVEAPQRAAPPPNVAWQTLAVVVESEGEAEEELNEREAEAFVAAEERAHVEGRGDAMDLVKVG